MAKYSIGTKVVKADSESRGTIIEVMPARRGRQLYRVSWDHGITDELEVNLIPDCNVSDPYERCMSGIFGSYSDYSKINTTFKIRSSNNSTISSLKASKTLFRAYQFKPLLKFLNSPNRRLLVADEVGLGKTIEAGHIMLELKHVVNFVMYLSFVRSLYRINGKRNWHTSSDFHSKYMKRQRT